MPGCVALNCSNRSENGFLLFSIPTNVERRKKWLQNLRREQWIPTKSACVCEVRPRATAHRTRQRVPRDVVHFDDSQFENRRADGWIKLKPNAVPTIFDVHNSPLRIDLPPKKSLNKVNNKKPEQNEVAATCVQEVAEVPIIPEMNIDYAAPLNHDVFNEVELSSESQKVCCHLTANRLLEKTKYAIHLLNISCE